MVYLHEIARPEYKSVTGSLGYVSLGIGVVLGILVVAAVIYTVTGGQFLFLLSHCHHSLQPLQELVAGAVLLWGVCLSQKLLFALTLHIKVHA